jgi:hypothetical protein
MVVLQVVRQLHRSVVINTFQSRNDFVLDLVPSESASFANDSDYDFRDATLVIYLKQIVNRKLYEYRYIIPDCLSNFTYNPSLCQYLRTKS